MASYKDYKSISAAKKAGSIYYTNKAGKKMLAVTKEQLDAYVDKVAKQITRLAPLTIQSCKMELMSPDDDAELAYKQCYESEDYEEGVRAFLVKGKPSERIPKFQGR